MPFPLERLIRKSSGMVVSWLFLFALALAGCDDPATTGPPDPSAPAGPTPCVPGELTRPDGTCQPAGLPPDMPCPPGELLLDDGITCQPAGLPPDMPCPPGELLLDDGTCQKAGVPPSACGAGFLPDGKEGCEPILPPDPCPKGLMATPGETECREVAPCGSGAWGDIPVEANTHFVDKAYAGGNSDGTQAKPWTTIQQGVTAAAHGAIVAVAAGSYPEDVLIQGKAVRLWGRCPAMVEVVGTGAQLAAIQIFKKAANGAEVHGIAATGAKIGVVVSGSNNVVIDRVWIHDTGDYALDVEDSWGFTSVVLKGSLVEQGRELGVHVSGSDASIEATVVRSTLPNAQGKSGRGINIQYDPATKARANVAVRACVIEQNRELGVHVSASDASIEATVVRSTLPNAQGTAGVGINIQKGAKAAIRESLVEQNHESGVAVLFSDAMIEATVVRSTQPTTQGNAGYGIAIQDHVSTDARANVTVRACLIEQNHEVGVVTNGSDVTIEATAVRSTLPNALGEFGRGIAIQGNSDTNTRANATVRGCLVEQNHDVGVYVSSSDATIEATVVRSTLPSALEKGGHGVSIENPQEASGRANVTVRACLVEQSSDLGILVSGSDATIEATVVRSTLPSALGEAGYGINIQTDTETFDRSNVTIRACLIEQNHEFGVSVLGSDATIEASVVRSNLPNGQGLFGRGVGIQTDPASKQRAKVTVRACVLDQHHEDGVFVAGSDATIEATLIRSTQPDPQWESGRGIDIQLDPSSNERADVAIRACLLEQNHGFGVFVLGSDVTIEATAVRSTLPNAQGRFGRGVGIQRDPGTLERSNATLRGCLIEQNHDVGAYVSASDAAIVDSAVRDTAPQKSDGLFGDGITVFGAAVAIQNVEVTRNARAGVASFGGQVVITGGVITCNAFDLEGEPFNDIPFSFDGSTGWQCSDKPPAECSELGACHVETTGIEAPSDLQPADPLPQ